jgi:outer membrane protein OmpA-like peptidoglycan-associated protein
MPLTDSDVMNILGDPIVSQIDFWIDNIHVRKDAYDKIADLIEREQILVVSGDDPDRAEYSSRTDTLTTHKAEPPANLTDKGTLLHECTHAIVDMERVTCTWHTNEIAAYAAENLYYLLSNSSPSPFNTEFGNKYVIPWIKGVGLDKKPGVGTRIPLDDTMPLIKSLNRYGPYHQDRAKLSAADGISPKAMKQLHIRSAEETSTHAFEGASLNAYRVPKAVSFDYNKHDLNKGAINDLQAASVFIKQVKDYGYEHVYITGHADSRGDSAQNSLSRLRAESVARWLVQNNVVKQSEVIIIGKGASMPVAPKNDMGGRARNCRVEILIM